MQIVEQAVVELGVRGEDEIALAPTERYGQSERRCAAAFAVDGDGHWWMFVTKTKRPQQGDAVKRHAAQPADIPRLQRHGAIESQAQAIDKEALATARRSRLADIDVASIHTRVPVQ